jgi:hypothetical protein
MQRCNCKKTIEAQNQIIRQCFNRIIELETHIMNMDPTQNVISKSVMKQLFPDLPPIIDIKKIEKITDKYFLIKLEEKYDIFLKKNEQLLLLHDVMVEELLDIRDAILLRIGRLKRQERMSLCEV